MPLLKRVVPTQTAIMTEDAAAAAEAAGDVTDDVRTVARRRAVDFSINSLLSSQGTGTESMSLTDTELAAARHRLAAAALWYPWLHSVASLQSATNNHQFHGKLSTQFERFFATNSPLSNKMSVSSELFSRICIQKACEVTTMIIFIHH